MRVRSNAKGHRATHLRAEGKSAATRLLLAIAAALFLSGWLHLPASYAAQAKVPTINGGLGPCSADFTVTDNAAKPLYDARIQVIIRHGFMNKRKTDLEIGTNSDGKARVEGLPEKVKKPLEFHIRHGQRDKVLIYDPAIDCHANFTIALESE
jgi:hypothetical protein